MSVVFIEAHPDGSLVYRVRICDPEHIEGTITLDLVVRKGEVEDMGEAGSFTWTPEDDAVYAQP